MSLSGRHSETAASLDLIHAAASTGHGLHICSILMNELSMQPVPVLCACAQVAISAHPSSPHDMTHRSTAQQHVPQNAMYIHHRKTSASTLHAHHQPHAQGHIRGQVGNTASGQAQHITPTKTVMLRPTPAVFKYRLTCSQLLARRGGSQQKNASKISLKPSRLRQCHCLHTPYGTHRQPAPGHGFHSHGTQVATSSCSSPTTSCP